jgi:site-specific recombinase XerD
LWHDREVTQALLPPLEDAWADFARSRSRKGRSVHTLNIYRKSYEQFWRWAETEGLLPDPGAITHRHVNAWTSAMLAAPLVRNGNVMFDLDPGTGERIPRPIQPNTVRIRWQNLRPFFSWWAEEMEEPNPFDKADTPRLEERPVPVVALDDVRAMLHACAGTDFEARRDTAIIRFLIDTGTRVGELVGMTLDSWDRRQDLVTLTGKTGTRIVPISPSTGEALARYMRVRQRQPHAASKALWIGARGRLSASGVAQMLNRRADQAEVPRLHPHVFRHSWAHELKRAGASEGDLMALGGWTTSTMVHRYGKSAAVARAQETGRRIALGDRL